MGTHFYRTLWKHMHASRDTELPRHKEKEKNNKKRRDTTATRDDLNFHMDRSFILEWNKRQICHPTEHCVCSLNVRVKIPCTRPPPYSEEDRPLISQRTPLQPLFAIWLGSGNRLNKHFMFATKQVKRLSITSLCLFLILLQCLFVRGNAC